jgi:uncharacterized protein (DUF433 family)
MVIPAAAHGTANIQHTRIPRAAGRCRRPRFDLSTEHLMTTLTDRITIDPAQCGGRP